MRDGCAAGQWHKALYIVPVSWCIESHWIDLLHNLKGQNVLHSAHNEITLAIEVVACGSNLPSIYFTMGLISQYIVHTDCLIKGKCSKPLSNLQPCVTHAVKWTTFFSFSFFLSCNGFQWSVFITHLFVQKLLVCTHRADHRNVPERSQFGGHSTNLGKDSH